MKMGFHAQNSQWKHIFVLDFVCIPCLYNKHVAKNKISERGREKDWNCRKTSEGENSHLLKLGIVNSNFDNDNSNSHFEWIGSFEPKIIIINPSF